MSTPLKEKYFCLPNSVDSVMDCMENMTNVLKKYKLILRHVITFRSNGIQALFHYHTLTINMIHI